MRLVLAAILVMSCGPVTAQSSAALSAVTIQADGAWHPDDFGAQPTEPTEPMSDARVGIQAAIDAAAAAGGGRVRIGCGRWQMSRAPIGSRDRVASLMVTGAKITIEGAGPCTILAPTGDAGKGDWRGIDVTNAKSVTVRDLTIDTSGLLNTEEQTHALQVTGPVAGVNVERVHFIHPRMGDARVGDCVRLLGNADAVVEDVHFLDVTFERCARSGIMIQRGVRSVQVLGGSFGAIGKTAIDTEPSSGGVNSDVSIIGVDFMDTGTAQGDFAVTLGGADAPEARVRIVGNDFERRGLWCYRCAQLVVAGNTFDGTPTTAGGGLVELRNAENDVIISGNIIRRLSATPGSVIRVVHQNGGSASNIMLSLSRIYSKSAGAIVDIESATDVSIADLDIEYAGAERDNFCVRIRATIARGDMISVHDVRCRSPAGGFLAAIDLSSSSAGFGAVSVHGNMSTGSRQGLRCEGSGAFKDFVFYGNDFDGAEGLQQSCALTQYSASFVPSIP